MLLTLFSWFFMASADAAELEVLVVDVAASTTLVSEEWDDPLTVSWPHVESLSGGGYVSVTTTTTTTGNVLACVEFLATSSSDPSLTCMEAEPSNDETSGSNWIQMNDYAILLRLDTSAGFTPGNSLGLDSPPSGSACTIRCEDGTAASASCHGGCKATCKPAAAKCL